MAIHDNLNSNLIDFENCIDGYSYNESGVDKDVNLNLTLQKGQYAIVACWNGGRGGVAPTVTGCTEIKRTCSDYGALTSSADGGIAYLVIYRADEDGATITHQATWANCGAIVL